MKDKAGWKYTNAGDPLVRTKLMVKSKKGNWSEVMINLCCSCFAEVNYLQFLNGDHQIPYISCNIMNQKVKWRIYVCCVGHVVFVVRDYNQILLHLLPQKSSLFEDIIQTFDQQIHPGLLKLN